MASGRRRKVMTRKAHMHLFPRYDGNCIRARLWHKKARQYWRRLGYLFTPTDKKRYCEAAQQIGYKAEARFLSHHPIAIEAIKDPSWSAVILLQLGFRSFAQFANIIIGKTLKTAFPLADLTFPAPNGPPYKRLEEISAHEKRRILDVWDDILRCGDPNRAMPHTGSISHQPPMRITPVLLPKHIQRAMIAPAASEASFPSPASTSLASPWPRRTRRGHAFSLTVPGTDQSRAPICTTPPRTPFSSPDVVELEDGDAESDVEPIVIEDESSRESSTTDSDDVPIQLTHGKSHQNKRSMKVGSKGNKVPKKAQRRETSGSFGTEVNDEVFTSPSSQESATSSCASEMVRSGSEQSRILGDSTFPTGSTMSKRKREPSDSSRTRKRSRPSVIDDRHKPREDPLKRLDRDVRTIGDRLEALERARTSDDKQWRKAKKERKKHTHAQDREIEAVRRDLDRLVMELRIREEHRLSGY